MKRLTKRDLKGLPTRISIGAAEYKVKLFDDLIDHTDAKTLTLDGEGCPTSQRRVSYPVTFDTMAGSRGRLYGQVVHPYQKIQLSRAQGLKAFRDTLLHEAIHTVEHTFGMSLVEDDVWRLGAGILTLLRSNPKLVKFLTK